MSTINNIVPINLERPITWIKKIQGCKELYQYYPEILCNKLAICHFNYMLLFHFVEVSQSALIKNVGSTISRLISLSCYQIQLHAPNLHQKHDTYKTYFLLVLLRRAVEVTYWNEDLPFEYMLDLKTCEDISKLLGTVAPPASARSRCVS